MFRLNIYVHGAKATWGLCTIAIYVDMIAHAYELYFEYLLLLLLLAIFGQKRV